MTTLTTQEFKPGVLSIEAVDLTAAGPHDGPVVDVSDHLYLYFHGSVTLTGTSTDAIFDLQLVPYRSDGTTQAGPATDIVTGFTHTADFDFSLTCGLNATDGVSSSGASVSIASGADAMYGAAMVKPRIQITTQGVGGTQTLDLYMLVKRASD